MSNGVFELYKGDSLTVMKTIMEGSIDAIITDPPFNISRENNFTSMNRAGIDFGMWDKDFDITGWIKTAEPLLKKGGNIVIFNDWKNMSYITNSLEDNGFDIKDLIRWEKTNPMPRNRDRRFITDYEVAVWAVKKGKKWCFNRIAETYERPLIKCGITPQGEKKCGAHSTQKPIAVMEWIVQRLTNENDIVLDPFMGSGSTGIACVKYNRRFTGIELDDNSYALAQNRIKEYANIPENQQDV